MMQDGKVVTGYLKKLRLAELSLVSRPANPGAQVVIFKQQQEPVRKLWAANADLPAGVRDNLPAAAQTAFREAANAALADGASEEEAMRIAWAAVKRDWQQDDDGAWMAKSAEIDPRLPAALLALAKIAKDEGEEPSAWSFNEVLDDMEAHDTVNERLDELQTLDAAFRESVCSIVQDTALDAEAKIGAIGVSVGQYVSALRGAFPAAATELTKLLKANPATAGLFHSTNTKEKSMAEKTELDKLKDTVADLTAKLEAASAGKAEAETISAMSDTEKQHLSTLKGDDRAAFLKAAPADRQEIVRKAATADEKIEIGGQTVRKSVVGAEAFAALKAQQTQIDKSATEIAKANDERELATFTKQAETELAHLPGDAGLKGSALRSIAKMADDKGRDAVNAMLKAGEAALAQLMREKGRTGGGAAGGSAQEKLDKEADALAASKKITKQAAVDEILGSKPGLYDEIEAERKAAEKAAA